MRLPVHGCSCARLSPASATWGQCGGQGLKGLHLPGPCALPPSRRQTPAGPAAPSPLGPCAPQHPCRVRSQSLPCAPVCTADASGPLPVPELAC